MFRGIGHHMLWNIVQGPDWLTGGSFGLEASAVTVILLLAATVVLTHMLIRRGGVVVPLWRRGRLATRHLS